MSPRDPLPATARHPHPADHFVGVPPLLAVCLRQDRRSITPWIAMVTALSASSVLAYRWVFDAPSERAALAASLGANPALSLIFGPARDLMSADGFNAWRAGQLGALLAGLMAVLIVIRNSRANEDSGQAELIASGVIARNSRLAVAVALAAIAAMALGLVCCAVTLLSGGGLAATVTLSASFTAAALLFAGVASVTAQLGSDARTSSTMAVATLGVLYVARGYLDVSNRGDWTVWLTPFGWLERTAPGVENNPWPLLLTLVVAGLLAGVGFWLQGRRDFGHGLFAQRPGPARAGLAGSVWGLALRLNAPTVLSWLVAFIVLGLLFGSLVTSIGSLIAENPAMAAVLASGAASASDLTFAFVVTVVSLLAILAAVLGVQIALHLHTEETDHRVEPLLATALRRSTYLASVALVALLGSALGLVVAGTCLGLVAHAQDPTISAADVIRQSLVTIPALWVLVGLALAAVGARPAVRLVGWGGVVATFVLTLLGPTFNLPGWALDFSPLRHVPDVTATSPNWAGLLALSAIAAALLTLAFIGFRRRNIS